MTLYFHNPGEIDIRGATIMGLNVKEQADSAIGFFGTGLKYSIACILRWKGRISIYSGERWFRFGASDLDFRGKNFQQIWMEENTSGGWIRAGLGFTTEYGKSWEPWQVFRELYSNAIDEGGSVILNPIAAEAGQTLIEVNCPELEKLFDQRNTIILPSTKHWPWQSDRAQLAGESSQQVYYRCVRVHELNTAITYNLLKGVTLTEDRTLKYSWTVNDTMAQALASCTDQELIRRALLADKPFAEADFTFPSFHDYSPQFIELAAQLYQQDSYRHRRLRDMLEAHRPDATKLVPVELTSIQQLVFSRAVKLVGLMGMPVRETPPQVVHIGESSYGRCHNQQVFLDPKALDQGTKFAVSTLYEEYTHLVTGHEDECREMQTHLFDTIVSLHEEHVFKEPC